MAEDKDTANSQTFQVTLAGKGWAEMGEKGGKRVQKNQLH